MCAPLHGLPISWTSDGLDVQQRSCRHLWNQLSILGSFQHGLAGFSDQKFKVARRSVEEELFFKMKTIDVDTLYESSRNIMKSNMLTVTAKSSSRKGKTRKRQNQQNMKSWTSKKWYIKDIKQNGLDIFILFLFWGWFIEYRLSRIGLVNMLNSSHLNHAVETFLFLAVIKRESSLEDNVPGGQVDGIIHCSTVNLESVRCANSKCI